MRLIALVCLALMTSDLYAGGLFRWVDSNGKVHYGDAAPADATQVEKKIFPGAPPPSMDIPYETRRAQQNFPVVLYVANNCTDNCDMARNLLSKRGIPFSEKVLKTQEDIDAFKALSGSGDSPTLAVGRNYLRGFLAEQWHSELDVAGYPKTAPYRASGTLPASAPAASNQALRPNP